MLIFFPAFRKFCIYSRTLLPLKFSKNLQSDLMLFLMHLRQVWGTCFFPLLWKTGLKWSLWERNFYRLEMNKLNAA